MKLHPPLTCLTVDGNLFVEGYKHEEPKFFCRTGKEDSLEIHAHYKRHDRWQASKVRYPVQEDYGIELAELIRLGMKDIKPEYLFSVYSMEMQKGIDISHLSDRIGVIEVPIKKEKGRLYPAVNQYNKLIKLKPIQEEESQDKMWREISTVYYNAMQGKPKTVGELEKELKQNYNLTRKQP